MCHLCWLVLSGVCVLLCGVVASPVGTDGGRPDTKVLPGGDDMTAPGAALQCHSFLLLQSCSSTELAAHIKALKEEAGGAGARIPQLNVPFSAQAVKLMVDSIYDGGGCMSAQQEVASLLRHTPPALQAVLPVNIPPGRTQRHVDAAGCWQPMPFLKFGPPSGMCHAHHRHKLLAHRK